MRLTSFNMGHHNANIAKAEQHELLAEQMEEYFARGGYVEKLAPSPVKSERPKKANRVQGSKHYRKYLRELRREGKVSINY